MQSNQKKYIEYAKAFSEDRKCPIRLGGSFSHGTSTPYSDVDIRVQCEEEMLRDLIYGYGNPIFLSSTTNPPGILIVIYEDGVALDLEVPAHDETICQKFVLRNDPPYQTARLFHRSLIKYLSGKREIGISVANEIEDYLNIDATITEENYKDGIVSLLNQFAKQYPLPEQYHTLLQELTEEIGRKES